MNILAIEREYYSKTDVVVVNSGDGRLANEMDCKYAQLQVELLLSFVTQLKFEKDSTGYYIDYSKKYSA